MGKFAKAQILGWKLRRKVKMRVTGTQPGTFGGRTGFDKYFMCGIEKKASTGKHFCVFFPSYI